ncbi:MAG: AAA family ATPase [Candidatus Tectomicrobia bacterium]|nr:AAA family ATPase [Candidatus Tectomicrobia bacterium]
MDIQKLIIEDVRFFAGRQEFNISPLTFLVGENSTGKSTVLGCLDALLRFVSGTLPHGADLDFNVRPYQMGVFTDVVRRSRPRKKSFKLGFESRPENKNDNVEYVLTLAEEAKGSEPVVWEQRMSGCNSEITFLVEKQEEVGQSRQRPGFRRFFEMLNVTEELDIKQFRVRMSEPFSDMPVFAALDAGISLSWGEEQEDLSPEEKELQSSMRNISRALNLGRRHGYLKEPYSFAPIMYRPRRTYDPLKADADPEGSDVPMVLMNMSRTDERGWEALREKLTEFGKSSGLFTDIHVRRLGSSLGDPFQLQIKVNGPRANEIDVGYGVNQLLPILVRLFNADPRMEFLMQQPEVHLHPRGQAELSSLFSALVKQRQHRFVIETHSDAMINRARIEIMNKRIAPEDVSLIYLEPAANGVNVHNVRFDDQANMLGAPDGYRDFFLNESDKLLGFVRG